MENRQIFFTKLTLLANNILADKRNLVIPRVEQTLLQDRSKDKKKIREKAESFLFSICFDIFFEYLSLFI